MLGFGRIWLAVESGANRKVEKVCLVVTGWIWLAAESENLFKASRVHELLLEGPRTLRRMWAWIGPMKSSASFGSGAPSACAPAVRHSRPPWQPRLLKEALCALRQAPVAGLACLHLAWSLRALHRAWAFCWQHRIALKLGSGPPEVRHVWHPTHLHASASQ